MIHAGAVGDVMAPLDRTLDEAPREHWRTVGRVLRELAVFDRGSVVVIAQQEAPDYWGISIRVGSHISLFDTGSGHVLLAFRSPEERKMMIAEYGKDGETVDLDPSFYERLDQIRVLPQDAHETAGHLHVEPHARSEKDRVRAAAIRLRDRHR